MEASNRFESISRRNFLLTVASGAIVTGILDGMAIGNGPRSTTCSDRRSEAVIDPPLRGEWLKLNPPGHTEEAHDFIGMAGGTRLPYPASGVPRHVLSCLPVDFAFGWDRPVYAPVEGTVLEVSTDEPDRERLNVVSDVLDTIVSPPSIEPGNIRPAAGNYVAIESATEVAFLAHLRQDSVAVTEGERIASGQFLGTVGNSGASVFPHLHFQLMSEWTTDVSQVDEKLLPYRFSEYERWTGNWFDGYSWEMVENCAPTQGERFRVRGDS